jgi:hypothetical protein
MSDLALYRIDIEDSAGKRANTMTTRAASEDAARRQAEEAIRRSPDLHIATVTYLASATISAEASITADAQVLRPQYNADLTLWSQRQADLLRRVGAGEPVNDQVDWENVAEEIEALGKSDRRELRNRIRIILDHLIRLQTSPAIEPRAAWQRTIVEQRDQVQTLLKDSPSLQHEVSDIIAEKLSVALTLASMSLTAHGEQSRVDPAGLTFTEDQVLGPWLP